MAVKNDMKKLRKEQRLKQSDLAMAVGMCEKSISNIELEKNPASLEKALHLAAYFKRITAVLVLSGTRMRVTPPKYSYICT